MDQRCLSTSTWAERRMEDEEQIILFHHIQASRIVAFMPDRWKLKTVMIVDEIGENT